MSNAIDRFCTLLEQHRARHAWRAGPFGYIRDEGGRCPLESVSADIGDYSLTLSIGLTREDLDAIIYAADRRGVDVPLRRRLLTALQLEETAP